MASLQIVIMTISTTQLSTMAVIITVRLTAIV
jgi:hypothetical protein